MSWGSRPVLLACAALASSLALPGQIRLEALSKETLPDLPARTTSVAAGDLDGDGLPDLVFGNYGEPDHIYRNLGGGRFGDVSADWLPPVAGNTVGVALADLDEDGDLDLVTGKRSSESRLFLNDGTGRMEDVTATHMAPVMLSVKAVIAFDANGDGAPDLMFGTDGSGTEASRLLLNDGSGRFFLIPFVPQDLLAVAAMAAVDVDGDGDLDVALANDHYIYPDSQQNRIFLNKGNGLITDSNAIGPYFDASRDVAAGDFDGDGDTDLVFANVRGDHGRAENALYFNNGQGNYADVTTSRLPPDNEFTESVAAGDIDGDGDLDIVFGNARRNSVYLNDGTGTFQDASGERSPEEGSRLAPADLALVDVDSDGDLDLVAALGGLSLSRKNRLYYNEDGRFVETAGGLLPPNTGGDLVDLDGDGDLDLLTSGRRELFIRMNDRGTRFLPAKVIETTLNRPQVETADVDGDGDLDVLLSGGLLLNDGTGDLTDVTSTHVPEEFSTPTAVGDMDGDGDIDVVAGPLFLNDGTGRFSALPGAIPDLVASVSDLGDVDGDGDADLVGVTVTPYNPFIGSYIDSVQLLTNDGTAHFAASPILTGQQWYSGSLELADLDRDGDLDLLVPGPRLLLNDGSGMFSEDPARLPGTTSVSDADAVDLDGDGDLDLVVPIPYGDPPGNRIWENDGQGRFEDVTGTAWQSPTFDTEAFVIGDVDGDSDQDLLAAPGYDAPGWILYQNLARQLHAPDVARLGHTYRMEIHGAHARYAVLGLGLEVSTPPVETPFGTLHLDLPAAFLTPPLFMPSSPVTVELTLPNVPSAAGLLLYSQAAVLDSTGQLRLTNLIADRLVR